MDQALLVAGAIASTAEEVGSKTAKTTGRKILVVAIASDALKYKKDEIGLTHFGVNTGANLLSLSPAWALGVGYGAVENFYPDGWLGLGKDTLNSLVTIQKEIGKVWAGKHDSDPQDIEPQY